MTPDVLHALIPMVATVATLGMPVLIVFVVAHFRFKNKELQADIEARKHLSERDRAYLEARIDRIEQVLLGQGRAQPSQFAAQEPLQGVPNPIGPRSQLANPGLFEPPPAQGEALPATGKR